MQKQNDYFDNKTNFIYHTKTFDELLNEINKRFISDKKYQVYYNYALNRWFNFWSAFAIEKIFCSLPNVKAAYNHKDRLKDFSIKGITFDHKTTVFPKNFNETINKAKKDPLTLIKWLYKNQSKQNRRHFHNRLFIVLYCSKGEHWKLKAEILWLKEIIENYLTEFEPNKLFSLELSKEFTTLADIIWAIK